MHNKIGIRREDKNEWERRVPFSPESVARFVRDHHLEFDVQTSPIRVFVDEEYKKAGARICADLEDAQIVFAVKEIPVELLRTGKVYVFFSHTIKGQPYNMPLLQRFLDLGATLVDYERIVDEKGRRLVFFGAHAGYAGMIDTLHLLGKRHASLGKKCRFQKVKQAYQYASLDEAKADIRELGDDIRQKGFPRPLVFGFSGYGNVSRGAQAILGQMPVVEIAPEDLPTLRDEVKDRYHHVYKVVFKEEHMAERIDGKPFELQTYYDHPELFKSKFDQHLPYLNVLVNCIYWTEQYPRLVTKALLKEMYEKDQRRLEVIGDISIDIDGAIECSYKATHSDHPSYVYEPLENRYVDGVEGQGPVILAVDNLPCELPKESSEHFAAELGPFVPAMAGADWTLGLEDLDLPQPIKTAIITHKGKLAPDYEYLQEFLSHS